MLPNFSTFVIRQRMFILVMAVALAVIGFRALQDLPVEAFPDVQDVQVQVVTQYPGQSPEEVERTISIPVEREMSGVPRATQVRSVSITGLSVVTLTSLPLIVAYAFGQERIVKGMMAGALKG